MNYGSAPYIREHRTIPHGVRHRGIWALWEREVRWEQSAQGLVSTAYDHHSEVAQDDRKLVGSFQQTAEALTNCIFSWNTVRVHRGDGQEATAV